MPGPFLVNRALNLHGQFDGRADRAKQNGIPTFIDYSVLIRDDKNRVWNFTGFVQEGIQKLDAIMAVLEQNGCACKVDRGRYDPINTIDLSNFRYLSSVVLPNGETIRDIQVRDISSTKLEKARVGDFEYYLNPDIERVTRGDKGALLSDDRHLPPIDLPFLDKKCGGCGGSITQQDLDMLAQLAALNVKGIVSLVDGTEDNRWVIPKQQKLEFSEFVYDPLFYSSATNQSATQQIAINAMNGTDAMADAVINANYRETLTRTKTEIFETTAISQDHQKTSDSVSSFVFDSIFGTFDPTTDFRLNFTITSSKTETDLALSLFNLSSDLQNNSTKNSNIKTDKTEDQKVEDSMLMRLLMNPVERKIWGKLFGLPELDISLSAVDWGITNTTHDAPKSKSPAPDNMQFSYPQAKMAEISEDKNNRSNGDEPPKFGGHPKIKVRVAAGRLSEYKITENAEKEMRDLPRTKRKQTTQRLKTPESDVHRTEKPAKQAKQKPRAVKAPPAVTRIDHGLKNESTKRQKTKEPKPREELSAQKTKAKKVLPVNTDLSSNESLTTKVRIPRRKESDRSQAVDRAKKPEWKQRAKLITPQYGQNFRSYTEAAKTRKASRFEKACLLSWLMEKPKSKKKSKPVTKR